MKKWTTEVTSVEMSLEGEVVALLIKMESGDWEVQALPGADILREDDGSYPKTYKRAVALVKKHHHKDTRP